MSEPNASEQNKQPDLHWTVLHPGIELVFLPVRGFPLSEAELVNMRMFLGRLIPAAKHHGQFSTEVFLQLEQLHGGDSRMRFARHAAEWVPEVGIGIWPNRDPPTTWSDEEFREFLPGQKPRPLMYQVFRVTGSPSAKLTAQDELLDVGALLEILTPTSSEKFLQTAFDLLQPGIGDPSINCYPFYVPLLERKAIEAASPEQMDQWLCGASMYIRESFEDQGVVVISRLPMKSLLLSMGAVPLGREESEWRLPN